ncbi:hypothetical protein KSF_100730 [Reticulibacter mediterranei]|uniref:Transposase IS701-like DDE domain-containing protein n=1 Tax=Reticulibacter mediterranei TaxID=2778369 RepID=A0A8J3IWY7_9CHLR|nr:transposase [Reticulibacter mediterranei]GHP00026.1 hypothetical protein KSF_100730 [Reticulibacter mediterranei]
MSAEYLADDPASSTPFYWPVSVQPFLPESWTQDTERRKLAQVPEAITQQTKPEIALSLLDRAAMGRADLGGGSGCGVWRQSELSPGPR